MVKQSKHKKEDEYNPVIHHWYIDSHTYALNQKGDQCGWMRIESDFKWLLEYKYGQYTDPWKYKDQLALDIL